MQPKVYYVPGQGLSSSFPARPRIAAGGVGQKGCAGPGAELETTVDLPDARRFGVLNDPTTSGPDRARRIADVAQRLNVELSTVDVHSPDDLRAAFRALREAKVQGINVVASAMLTALMRSLSE